jgi:hypothetical protein
LSLGFGGDGILLFLSKPPMIDDPPDQEEIQSINQSINQGINRSSRFQSRIFCVTFSDAPCSENQQISSLSTGTSNYDTPTCRYVG